MLKNLYQRLFRFIGVQDLYHDVVVEDRLTKIRPQIRADLTSLLQTANDTSEFFRGKFAQFLNDNGRSF